MVGSPCIKNLSLRGVGMRRQKWVGEIRPNLTQMCASVNPYFKGNYRIVYKVEPQLGSYKILACRRRE